MHDGSFTLEINMFKTMTTFHLLLNFYFLQSVLSIGTEYSCPKFQIGVNLVTCMINKTAVDDAACDSLQKNVTFEKGETVLCFAPRPSPSGCSTSHSTSSNPCWCVDSGQNIFTYTISYVATSSDVGAILECKYCITQPNLNAPAGCKIDSFDSEKQASRAHMIYTTAAWLLPVFLSFNDFYG